MAWAVKSGERKDVAPESFKAVMRNWPTGVAVITTKYNNQLFGLTINSFTSVSLSPPLISFCLNRKSGSFVGFSLGTRLSVNILAEDQQKIAEIFAIKHIDKFSGVKYYESKITSCPLIEGAICFIECEKLYEYEGGDHIIMIAKVLECTINNHLKPLIYFAREYKNII